MDSWTCSCCGQSHEGVPFSFAADYPDNYANMTTEERADRAICGSDQCIIDGEVFMLRGLIEIPIHGLDDPFLWGVWASIFKQDYEEIDESWEEEGRETRRGPYKGRLVNELSIYSNSFNLRLTILVQPLGSRPLFRLEDPNPLTTQQREGISLEDARRMAEKLLHFGNMDKSGSVN
jgi:hypothetical protein